VSRRLTTAEPASEELAAAVRWYEERRRGLGAEFYDAIVRTIERISHMPDAGSPLDQLKARRMLVTGFPYQIVYRVDSDEIRILAFAHLKRRPGFWGSQEALAHGLNPKSSTGDPVAQVLRDVGRGALRPGFDSEASGLPEPSR
jgi:plasmid stabilization system protein ParE